MSHCSRADRSQHVALASPGRARRPIGLSAPHRHGSRTNTVRTSRMTMRGWSGEGSKPSLAPAACLWPQDKPFRPLTTGRPLVPLLCPAAPESRVRRQAEEDEEQVGPAQRLVLSCSHKRFSRAHSRSSISHGSCDVIALRSNTCLSCLGIEGRGKPENREEGPVIKARHVTQALGSLSM